MDALATLVHRTLHLEDRTGHRASRSSVVRLRLRHQWIPRCPPAAPSARAILPSRASFQIKPSALLRSCTRSNASNAAARAFTRSARLPRARLGWLRGPAALKTPQSNYFVHVCARPPLNKYKPGHVSPGEEKNLRPIIKVGVNDSLHTKRPLISNASAAS